MRLSLETNFPLQFRIAFAKNFSFRFVPFFPQLWAVAKCCCHFPQKCALRIRRVDVNHTPCLTHRKKTLLLHLGNKSHILKSEVCRKAEWKNKTAEGKQMRQLTQNVRWPKGKRRNGKMKEERPEQSEGNHFRSFYLVFQKRKSPMMQWLLLS